MPLAHGDQLAPFQRAMLAHGTPPASRNWPAATRSPFGITASARTTTAPTNAPDIPDPSAAHVRLTGSYVARLLAATAPAPANAPPTASSGGSGPARSRSHRI